MNIQRDTEYRFGGLVQGPEYLNNRGQITYEYVDLGLPSGTLWAKMNVGASSETDYGLYFAWGETQGYTASQVGTDKQFSSVDYKFNPSGDGSTFTKYNSTDNKIVLEAEDDAASVNMGGEWHMPTTDQCYELLKETTNGFVTNEGVFTQFAWSDGDEGTIPTETTATIDGWNIAGHLFFKNTYASVTDAIYAEDYLFIPVAGYCYGGIVEGVGEYGFIWLSSLNAESIHNAWDLICGSDSLGLSGIDDSRDEGMAIRGVIGELENPK